MRTFLKLIKNPYLCTVLVALAVQTLALVFFYILPDPLGLSLTEMFEGKIIWQVFMAFGAILVMGALFTFARAPRALAIFYAFYFFVAVVDYDLFRFSHQRLSYSFLRTYFHISNITDATTVTTLGGDLLGTGLWIALVLAGFAGAAIFVTLYTLRLRKGRASLSSAKPSKKPSRGAVLRRFKSSNKTVLKNIFALIFKFSAKKNYLKA